MAHLGEQSEEASGRWSLKGRRILVVEDESLIAMEVMDYLERAGATVVGPVGRVDRALGKAEKEILDAALLDVDLNGEGCWPVADALVLRRIPFAFTTGFEGSIVMPERFAGFPYFSKPYSEEEMLAVLRKILIRNHGQETQSA